MANWWEQDEVVTETPVQKSATPSVDWWKQDEVIKPAQEPGLLSRGLQATKDFVTGGDLPSPLLSGLTTFPQAMYEGGKEMASSLGGAAMSLRDTVPQQPEVMPEQQPEQGMSQFNQRWSDYKNEVRARLIENPEDMDAQKRWEHIQRSEDEQIAAAQSGQRWQTAADIGEIAYSGLRGAAESASFGVLTPVYAMAEKGVLGERFQPDNWAERISGMAGSSLGMLVSMKALGDTSLIQQLKTPFQRRAAMTLATQVPTNIGSVLAGDKSIKEGTRDAVLNSIINMSGMIPETYVQPGMKNFVSQVAWDLAADAISDATVTGRLTKDNYGEWAVNIIPNVIFSAFFAAGDLANKKGFPAEQLENKKTFEAAKKRAKEFLSGEKPMPTVADKVRGRPMVEGMEPAKEISPETMKLPEAVRADLEAQPKPQEAIETPIEAAKPAESTDITREEIEASRAVRPDQKAIEDRLMELKSEMRLIDDPDSPEFQRLQDEYEVRQSELQAMAEEMPAETSGKLTMGEIVKVDPNNLTFREKEQNRTGLLNDITTDNFSPIVTIKDDNGSRSILDGHNRAKVAIDREESLNAIDISRDEYSALAKKGYDDTEITYATLLRAEENSRGDISGLSSELESQFPGASLSKRGIEALRELNEFAAEPKPSETEIEADTLAKPTTDIEKKVKPKPAPKPKVDPEVAARQEESKKTLKKPETRTWLKKAKHKELKSAAELTKYPSGETVAERAGGQKSSDYRKALLDYRAFYLNQTGGKERAPMTRETKDKLRKAYVARQGAVEDFEALSAAARAGNDQALMALREMEGKPVETVPVSDMKVGDKLSIADMKYKVVKEEDTRLKLRGEDGKVKYISFEDGNDVMIDKGTYQQGARTAEDINKELDMSAEPPVRETEIEADTLTKPKKTPETPSGQKLLIDEGEGGFKLTGEKGADTFKISEDKKKAEVAKAEAGKRQGKLFEDKPAVETVKWKKPATESKSLQQAVRSQGGEVKKGENFKMEGEWEAKLPGIDETVYFSRHYNPEVSKWWYRIGPDKPSNWKMAGEFLDEAVKAAMEGGKPADAPAKKQGKMFEEEAPKGKAESFLDKLESEARDEIKLLKSQGTAGMAKPIGIAANYVVIGAAKIARGTIKFADWSAQMIKEFGEGIKPQLRAIYDASKKIVSSGALKDEKLLKSTAQEVAKDIDLTFKAEPEDVARTIEQKKIKASKADQKQETFEPESRVKLSEHTKKLATQMRRMQKPDVAKALEQDPENWHKIVGYRDIVEATKPLSIEEVRQLSVDFQGQRAEIEAKGGEVRDPTVMLEAIVQSKIVDRMAELSEKIDAADPKDREAVRASLEPEMKRLEADIKASEESLAPEASQSAWELGALGYVRNQVSTPARMIRRIDTALRRAGFEATSDKTKNKIKSEMGRAKAALRKIDELETAYRNGEIDVKTFTAGIRDAQRQLTDHSVKLTRTVKAATPADAWQMLTEMTQGSMLTLNSLFKNPGYNVYAQTMVYGPSRIIGAIFDGALSRIRRRGRALNAPSLSPKDLKRQLLGVAQGLKEAGQIAVRGNTVDIGEITKPGADPYGEKIRGLAPVQAIRELIGASRDIDSSDLPKVRNKKTGKLEIPAKVYAYKLLEASPLSWVPTVMLRGLPFGDVPFGEGDMPGILKNIGQRDLNLKGDALDRFIKAPPQWAKMMAVVEAKDRLFQGENMVAGGVSRAIGAIENIPYIGKSLGKPLKFAAKVTLAPFVKTLVNVAKLSFELSNPVLPLVSGFTKIAQGEKMLKQGADKTKANNKIRSGATDLGTAVIGYAYMLVGQWLAEEGIVTAQRSKSERGRTKEYSTREPSTFNVSRFMRLFTEPDGVSEDRDGDTKFSLENFGPIASPLSIEASLFRDEMDREARSMEVEPISGKKVGLGRSNITDRFMYSIQAMIDSTIGKGVNSLAQAIDRSDPSYLLEQAVQSMTSSLAPNEFKRTTKVLHGMLRQNRSTGTGIGFLEDAMSRQFDQAFGGMKDEKKRSPHMYNPLTGEKVKVRPLDQNWLMATINPIKLDKIKWHPTEKLLIDLQEMANTDPVADTPFDVYPFIPTLGMQIRDKNGRKRDLGGDRDTLQDFRRINGEIVTEYADRFREDEYVTKDNAVKRWIKIYVPRMKKELNARIQEEYAMKIVYEDED